MQFDLNKRRKASASLKRNPKSTISKLLLTGILLVSIPFGMKYAAANEAEAFQTVHHVYLDDEYIGLVADEKKLEQLTEEKIEEVEQQFEDFPLAIQENYSVIPERVFNVKADDEPVLEQLAEELVVETEGIGIQVNNETVLYVRDEESYEEVIKAFKLQAVSEEELKAYEAAQEEGETLPELAEGETRLTKMVYSAEMASATGKVKPEEILTVSEAIDVLNKGTLNEKKYEVQSGDVLGKIASKHDMTTKELMELNEGITEDTVLQIGDELAVTFAKPHVELEVHYETKKKQTVAYKKVTKKDKTMDKGTKKVTQEGKDGEKVTTSYIREKNGQVIGRSTIDEQVLAEPVEEITVIGTKVTPSKGTGTFTWPTVGGYVSSPMGQRWGRMHRGIDIARPSNRSILAADNGVVVSTGRDGSYGNKIVINHNNGYQTLYAHLSSIDVKPGQTVSAGSTIGVMGDTGNSTGIHLHFEVTKNGSLIDPLSVLR